MFGLFCKSGKTKKMSDQDRMTSRVRCIITMHENLKKAEDNIFEKTLRSCRENDLPRIKEKYEHILENFLDMDTSTFHMQCSNFESAYLCLKIQMNIEQTSKIYDDIFEKKLQENIE